MVFPFWVLGVPGRMKTIKEGKLLKEQIDLATQTGAALANTAEQAQKMKPNLLVPGIAAAGAGLLASKVAADKITPRNTDQMPRNPQSDFRHLGNGNVKYIAQLQAENYANFVAFDLLAGIENGLATTIHALKNAGMKKKLTTINNANELTRAQIEAQRIQQMKNVPMKLGAIALGTGAIATPTMMYMNGKYNEQSNS